MATASASGSNVLTYEGCNFFRQRLTLSILSGKAIKIKKIRHKDDNPGLTEFESNLLALLDEITKGAVVVISHSGTSLYYQPGMLVGGHIEHTCNVQRSIGYYLEVLACLAPFCKEPLKATLSGVTNDVTDPSVDLFKFSTLPVLKRFLGTDEGLDIKVVKRGVAPLGGGEVLFTCPCRQKLRSVQLYESEKIKRIRGISWAVNVSPLMCNKMVESARSILNRCLPDVYIYTDHRKRDQSGKSPGFGLTLVAESTNGTFLCAEACSQPQGSTEDRVSADDLGLKAARYLLDELYRGGCVDSVNQGLACVLMTLGDQDVSKIQTGPLSNYTVNYLRHIRDFFGIVFKIDVQPAAVVDSDDDNDNDGGDKEKKGDDKDDEEDDDDDDDDSDDNSDDGDDDEDDDDDNDNDDDDDDEEEEDDDDEDDDDDDDDEEDSEDSEDGKKKTKKKAKKKDDDTDKVLRLGGDKVLLTCTGVGFRNLNKVIL